jgi:hypothetical protein
MTITNTILRNDYVANGSSTVFSFTFIVLSETNGYTIQVITTDLIGVETIKTQGVDYTVQLNDNGLGTITFNTAPTLNHKITLLQNVPYTQETDYIKAGTDKFPAESHEKALDKLTLISKQLLEKFNRVVSLPKSSNLSNIDLPINSSNANKILVINNEGDNLTTANLADVGMAPVSDFAKTLLDDTTALQARATLDCQQSNINLTAFANLIGASNKIPYFTGSGAMTLQDKLATTTNQGLTYLNNPITIANNSTDPNNDIDFFAGNFQFADGSGQAVLSAMTKRLDASWTTGTNQGGLFSGQKANSTWYYLYAIANPTSGVVDAGFDISPTSPTLPTGFTKRSKALFAVKTDSSGNILGGTWLNDRSFYFNVNILEEQNGVTTGNLPLIGVPLLPLKAIMRSQVGANVVGAFPALAVGISNVCIIFVAGTTYSGADYGNGEVPTSNATIYRSITASGSFNSQLFTNGYILTN